MPVTSAPPPPSKSAAPKTTAPRKPDLTAARTEALTGLGQLAQVPLIAARQTADAGAIAMHWPRVSQELASLAGKDERVAKLIDPLMQAGPYAGLITALLPLIMQLGVNHGMVQAGVMGTVPAATLASQMDTALAQAQLEALTVQRDAEEQARKLRDEISSLKSAA